jgi:S1-C subfamily serine protease
MTTAADADSEHVGTTGFAIPIETALGIVDQIRRGDESGGVHVGDRALLGVVLSESSENPPFADGSAGARIRDARADSPAEAAGLGDGDTITRVAGRPIRTNDDLRAVLDRHHPGDQVVVSWTDADGDHHRRSVTLTEGPPA